LSVQGRQHLADRGATDAEPRAERAFRRQRIAKVEPRDEIQRVVEGPLEDRVRLDRCTIRIVEGLLNDKKQIDETLLAVVLYT